MPSIHDRAALEAYCRQARLDPQHLRRLRNAFYKRGQTAEEALRELPADKRETFARSVPFHALELHSRHDSALDGASKLIFRTPPGLLLESVILRIASGRTSLCVSSQVGCAARCAFCATGKMGLAANLSEAEILDQVVRANQILAQEKRRLRNLVFMGMGEPFHNEDNLYQALDVLCCPRCFAFSPGRVLVSTVGLPDAMRRFARRFPGVGLALSLHSARPEIRERLVPLARRHPLPELLDALREVTALQGRRVMIEYLLLRNVNDSPEDARALTEYLSGLPAHVNLIPYNPIDGALDLEGTDSAGRQAFAARVREAGFPVTLRYSLGADVAAACGQLVRREFGANTPGLSATLLTPGPIL